MTPPTEHAIEEALHVAEEYERQPVPERAWKGHKAFWGMYAGEHTAGTEFLIGPLFLIQWGVGGIPLLAGLLLGNLMAVLSWRFLTAPIAARARMTLYFQLERITGRKLVTLYNLANGILFCFLAGAMITVSASAFGPALPEVAMPSFHDRLPPGPGWCVIVLCTGAAMTVVAVRGYDTVARIGHLAAPWMLLVFVACGFVMLGKIGTNDVMSALQPVAGVAQTKGFWAVFFFAWFCNAAVHVGMGDLSILRYARHPSAGWASAAGMFLGHFIAWLCAALLFVYWVKVKGGDVSSAMAVPLGTMVNDAAGLTGLICVVVAGWTTANPTLYRAGLAFQGLFPRLPRWVATAVAGAVCTVAGAFPAFATGLLDFVGIYGTILAPVGAILFVDFWLARRSGFTAEWAHATGRSFNTAALLAWLLPLAVGAWFYKVHDVFPSYMTLPVWIAAGLLYVFFARFLPSTPSPRPS